MTKDEFMSIDETTMVGLRPNLVQIYRERFSDEPNGGYAEFLEEIQGTAQSIEAVGWDTTRNYAYSNIIIEGELGWNIYEDYVDKIVTKEDNPEYWL